MKKDEKMNARKFRFVLLAILVVLIGLAAVGFYFIQDQFVDKANLTKETRGRAQASEDDLQALQRIQAKLRTDRDIFERAQKIVAESKSYQYQNQIIEDILKYGKEAGVSIQRFDFRDATDAVTAQTTTPNGTAAAKPISGLKSILTSITLDPASTTYTGLLKFIRLVEQNLTKMQISTIAVTSGGSGDSVTSDALVIEIYTK